MLQVDTYKAPKKTFYIDVDNLPPEMVENYVDNVIKAFENSLKSIKKKPGVYLSGPMAECEDAEMFTWRNEARKALEKNFTIYDPCSRDFRGKPMTKDIRNQIVEGDLKDIDNCKVVLVNYFRPKALPPMVGTSMEVFYAYQTKKFNVLVDNGLDKVSPWLRYHVDETFTTLPESYDLLNQLAEAGYFEEKVRNYRQEIESNDDFDFKGFPGYGPLQWGNA
jgi:hypothetical protein